MYDLNKNRLAALLEDLHENRYTQGFHADS